MKGNEMKYVISVQTAMNRLTKDLRGQDLVEYALMAGFVALAAGATMPTIATSLSTVFSQIGSAMINAASQG